jgi:hypothetical protein
VVFGGIKYEKEKKRGKWERKRRKEEKLRVSKCLRVKKIEGENWA